MGNQLLIACSFSSTHSQKVRSKVKRSMGMHSRKQQKSEHFNRHWLKYSVHHGTFHEAFLRLAFSSVECTGNYVVNMVSNPRINLSKPDKDALLGDFSWHQRSLTFHIWVKINFFFDREHLLKRDDLSAHLEVNKCLNISPLFQTSFALLFDHYIE